MGDENMAELATFAAGCFWGIEAAFNQLPGVLKTRVGYAGGHHNNPTYELVCSDTTGHAEAVEVEYDPKKISYEQLLDVFWQIHDPTTLNRQGPDIGSQYRSIIFYRNPEQERLAKASRDEIDSSGRFKRDIVTEILPIAPFYEAEDYHQKYYEKHGLNASCRIKNSGKE